MTGTNTNDGTATTVSLYRMLQGWDESATWNSLLGGISADGTEAVSLADDSVAPSYNNSGVYRVFDVTGSVQAWADGRDNYGWAMLATGTDGWRFDSADSGTALGDRPILEITYAVPEPTTLALLSLAATGFAAGVPVRGLLARRRVNAGGRHFAGSVFKGR
jgi:hypothetical protein